MLIRALLPPLLVAACAALWAPDAALVVLSAGIIVAALATLAAVVSRAETATDPMLALRASLAGLAVRLLGGLAVVLVGAATLPAHAALVAVVTGFGLAGAVGMQAWAVVARREVTSG